MSSVQLLDKTRKIGKLLHNNNSSKVVFNDICKVMREILNSNVLVISRKGKVLGVGKSEGIESIHELIEEQVGGFIDGMLNERLLGILSTKENVNLETLGFESRILKSSRQLSHPLRLQENGLALCLFTSVTASMILMILFSASTARQLWGWKCSGRSTRRAQRRAERLQW